MIERRQQALRERVTIVYRPTKPSPPRLEVRLEGRLVRLAETMDQAQEAAAEVAELNKTAEGRCSLVPLADDWPQREPTGFEDLQ